MGVSIIVAVQQQDVIKVGGKVRDIERIAPVTEIQPLNIDLKIFLVGMLQNVDVVTIPSMKVGVAVVRDRERVIACAAIKSAAKAVRDQKVVVVASVQQGHGSVHCQCVVACVTIQVHWTIVIQGREGIELEFVGGEILT